MQCGATDVIDLNEFTTPEARVQRVKELTDGRGADIVVEVVGLAAATVEGLDMVRINGKYVDIGNIVPQTVTLPATKISSHRSGGSVSMHYNPWIIPAALDLLVRTKDKYPLSRVVSHSFPPRRGQQGLRVRGVARQGRGHGGDSRDPQALAGEPAATHGSSH